MLGLVNWWPPKLAKNYGFAEFTVCTHSVLCVEVCSVCSVCGGVCEEVP